MKNKVPELKWSINTSLPNTKYENCISAAGKHFYIYHIVKYPNSKIYWLSADIILGGRFKPKPLFFTPLPFFKLRYAKQCAEIINKG